MKRKRFTKKELKITKENTEELEMLKATFDGVTLEPFKDKKGKLRFDLIPPEMDESFAEVATFGIEKLKHRGVKNPDRNWEKGLKLVSDHLAAAKRHINKWEQGMDLDEESSLNHLQHAHWHITAMITQIKRNRIDLDDRVNHSLFKDNTKEFTSTKEFVKVPGKFEFLYETPCIGGGGGVGYNKKIKK